ncbi:SymE family type I addiction module toxin [Ralstonia solanacearum]|uniref:SymE family type I addiction module toxin n=1 Tax=Ralstonia solanacearum TaxID=305 RepID=UPI00123AEA46|nr:SymE family type I addiction module toxin [Ralstonia solanacearum]AYB54556.1 type I toxin-antitoxin system SymE family toxin [Ralstonia solanacearum]AYB58947.1 type I toxin-antitoxin system SymE family toxin [Ralstonia solanacearum]
MADANHRAHPAVTERFTTIQQSRRYQRNWFTPAHLRPESPRLPWIKLAGRWIEQAGFTPGQRVRVVVEHERMIITAE